MEMYEKLWVLLTYKLITHIHAHTHIKGKVFNKIKNLVYFLFYRDRKITAPKWLITSNNTNQNPEKKHAGTSSPDSRCQSNISEGNVCKTDSRETDKLLVAAIDFGTTFSGYAFALRSELEKDPSRINIPIWRDSNGGFVSYKTSSTVLLNKDKQLVDFGFDAESKYAELLEYGEHEEYFYFRHYKMMLYDHAKTEVR